MVRVLCALAFLICSCRPEAHWPTITNETKPWTRWWWHGSAVTKEGITAELEAFSKAGLGGVEITPIYGVKGFEDKFVPYLSDQWMELFIHTLTEAKRLDLGVDIATGTGWPFGGPWISDEYSSRRIYHKIYDASEFKKTEGHVTFTQPALLRTVNPVDIDIKDLKQPIERNANLQELAIDQVQFERTLQPFLTQEFVDSKTGTQKVIALFPGWHGKMVERAGPGGEGNVIDHFSKEAIDHYLSRFDSAFKGHDISSLRAFFNDSYEVDDASGAADWTSTLPDAFRENRGYDLKDHLHELFDSTSADGERVLYDYRLTISELLLNNFTTSWTSWAHKQNAITRNQAHGSPANILDLYSTVDIPEIEGTDPLRIKMATSAANVSNKRLVSSESATWLDEHFESSLGDIKEAVDVFLLNGVNHIFYHGTAYSPQNEPWPGWLFYAAVHLNQRNPQWVDFDVLNNYVARCQAFLQNSKADNDLLLYYPIADPMSKFGPQMIEHFDGIGKQFHGSEFEKVATMLLEKGYTFDFVSDKQLKDVKGKIIVVPNCKYIPAETVDYLNARADSVIMIGGKPRLLAGLKMKDQLPRFSNKIVVTNEFSGPRETMADLGLQFTRRTNMYLIKNTREAFDDFVPLLRQGNYILFDPMTGVIGKPEQKNGKVRLQLAKGQTIIVAQSRSTAQPFPYIDATSQPLTLNLNWTITIDSDTVPSWPENYSGTAVYSTHLDLPGSKNGWILDLGDVRESALVKLNGREVARLIAPPFRVKIEPSMAQKDNVLEIRIANLMVNRIAELDRKGIVWKKFYNINFPAKKPENRKDGLFDASNWVSSRSGLPGPVQLLFIGDGVER